MEDKQQGQDIKASCRRSRKDEQGRDFICGCGKKYLSYPALYTHIKTKHDGVQPQGTQKTGNGVPFKRTKPRMDESIQKSILAMMTSKDLTILNELSNCEGNVSVLQRIRKQSLPKQLYEYYLNNMVKITSFKAAKSSTIQMVLIMFLFNVGEYICEPAFQVFIQFTKVVLNCFNEHGQEIFESVFKHKVNIMKPFTTAQCRYLPIICDFMVRFYIPAQHRQIDTTIMEFIFYDFSRWMQKNNLTDVQVTLKKAYDPKIHFNAPIWRTLKQYKINSEQKVKIDGQYGNQDIDQSDQQVSANDDDNQKEVEDQQQNYPSSEKDVQQEKLSEEKKQKENPKKAKQEIKKQDKVKEQHSVP